MTCISDDNKSLQWRLISQEGDDYGKTLLLRHEILRKPLGKSIAEDDLTQEKEDTILGVFFGEKLVGMATMLDYSENEARMRYLVVEENWRHRGVGSSIVLRMEKSAVLQGKSRMVLTARTSAVPFYEKLGYKTTSGPFFPEHVPVEHVWMAFDLPRSEGEATT